MTIRLRAMTEQDLDAAWALSQQLHWPHRREDWQQALTSGNGVVAEYNGQLAGTALYWRWGNRYATVGLVIVDERLRGRGIGQQLMQAVLNNLPEYVVRLHATDAGKGLYQQLGFVITGAINQYQTHRLGGIPAYPPARGEHVREAVADDVAALVEIDEQAHGLHRAVLMAELLTSTRRMLVLEDGRRSLNGFACLRQFGHGYTIGPVIARNRRQARVLISALLAELPDQFVRIDSDQASGLSPWLVSQGFQVVDTTCMMVKGARWQPATRYVDVFALMTQAMA